MSAQSLEDGYWKAYREFYRWKAIFTGAAAKNDLRGKLRHLAIAGGWKKAEPLWDMIIRAKRLRSVLPMLENTLGWGTGRTADGIAAKAAPTVSDLEIRPTTAGRG